jgi:predicted AlkP superfamily phosphohydrolase/phosphomutase
MALPETQILALDYEARITKLSALLDEEIKQMEESLKLNKPRKVHNWQAFILKLLAQDWRTYDELLELVEASKTMRGGIIPRDILTGTLNQLDDDGLIQLQRSGDGQRYCLTTRGRERVGANAA